MVVHEQDIALINGTTPSGSFRNMSVLNERLIRPRLGQGSQLQVGHCATTTFSSIEHSTVNTKMSSGRVHRVTLFKIEDPENQQKLLSFYKEMKTKALKDSKPYILSCEAGPTVKEQRNKGFTIAAKTTFRSMADFDYYDKECAAHKELAAFAKSVHDGVMMVYFESVVD